MKRVCDYSLCTACGACAGICPKSCINFISDGKENGHLFPEIDQKICIDCRLCEKTCPVNHPISLNTPVQVNAAYAIDESVCNSSSSGGLAYSLSAEIIKQGGVIYGSVMEYGENFGIFHKRIDGLSDLAQTQGSKYVQSKIDRSIFQTVKRDLESGRDVLFAGTGCQIAGIKNYLKKDYPNFYTIDIICHGVPPVKLLKDYLSLRYDLPQIKKLRFRSKSGFNIYGVYGVYGEQIKLPLHKNLYMMGFMKGLYYRSSCYRCSYATSDRGGDITLGDFWGLKTTFSNRPASSKGTSVVMLNTDKGKDLLERTKASLALKPRPLEEAIAGNPQLRYPSKKHYAYYIFKKLYPIVGFKIAARMSLIREKFFYAYALPLMNKINQH